MKTVIPNATPERNKFSGQSTIHSTRQFFEFCPDWYYHLIPNHEITVNLDSFARALPLPVPTMGKLDLCYRAFFVPYSSVFKGWHDFKANTLHNDANDQSSLIPTVRTFTERQIRTLFIGKSDVVTSGKWDFVNKNGNVTTRYSFKPEYRYMYKIFLSLGYRLRPVSQSHQADYVYNALPLLCACRVYLDYYYPSQFRNESIFNYVKQVLERDNGTIELSAQDLEAIFNLLQCTCYDDNIFVNSFANGMMPNTPYNDVILLDPFYPNEGVAGRNSTTINKETFASLDSDHNNSIGSYVFSAIQRITQYFKRNTLAGSYAYERMLARFGIQISNDFSKYIDSYICPINIGDVMSTTDNYDSSTGSGAQLGSYAGKALGFDVNGDKSFHFIAPDYGMLLIVASIIPKVGYVQGVDRHNLHITPTQFFEPEFDGLGMQAISKQEVYSPASDSGIIDTGCNGTFGFAPTYYEYKVFRDNVFGDYALDSINEGMDAFYLNRLFDPNSFGDYADVMQEINFVRASDYYQYLRIFGLEVDERMNGLQDPFRVRSIYNIEAFANMRKLYDDIDFDQLQHNGSGSSEVNISGSKLN